MRFARSGIFLGGLLLGLGLLLSNRRPHPPPLVLEAHYRHPVDVVDASLDLDGTVAALEARVEQHADPFDTAELAELYLRRALRTGDRTGLAASEAMATRSLALLSAPNGARLTLARLSNARHDFRRAIALATEQLASKPSAGAHAVLATAHLALGDLVAAIEAADRAVAMRADSEGLLLRALVLEAQGRDTEAGFDFARAAALEGFGEQASSARLRALWGRFLLRRGEYASAALVLDEALRIVPRDPLATAQRAELALRTGRPGEARALFADAFAASRQLRYLIDEARAAELAGDGDGAQALRVQVEKLLRRDGAGHQLELIELLIDRGQAPDEALRLAREEVERRHGFAARYQLARALAWTGRHAEALSQVQLALAGGTREAQLYELAAQLELALGHPARAAMYTQLADELDPARTGWRRLGVRLS